MHVISNVVLPGELVFDIGANAGNKSHWFLERGARVVAVEPQPAMVEKLNLRFEGNSSITIIPKGLSEEPGSLVMNICSTDTPISTFSDEWKETGRFSHAPWDRQERIEITTLDQLISEFGKPRYAKIDVEGFEKKVMLGLSGKKIDTISLEFMSETLRDTIDLFWYAKGLGYSRFNFSAGESDHFELPVWVGVNEIIKSVTEHCAGTPEAWGDVYMA